MLSIILMGLTCMQAKSVLSRQVLGMINIKTKYQVKMK